MMSSTEHNLGSPEIFAFEPFQEFDQGSEQKPSRHVLEESPNLYLFYIPKIEYRFFQFPFYIWTKPSHV